MTRESPGTRIKVSGIKAADDAVAAVEAGVDLVGCVFYAGSPRYVTLRQAWDIRRAINGRAELVGIFVDAPAPLVRRMADHCGLDRVQLFGSESKETVEAIPLAFKAVTAQSQESAEAAGREFLRRGKPHPSLLLHLTGEIGSDWGLAAELAERGSLILAAAGLQPGTAADTVAAVDAWAVDVWDSVEAEPGRLDRERLAEFVAGVRQGLERRRAIIQDKEFDT